MQPRERLDRVHLVREAAHVGAVPGPGLADHVRVDGVAGGQQTVPGRRQVLLHVSVAARGDQCRHDPGRGDHVHRAILPVQFGEPLQRVRQLTVLGFGRRPAQQRHVTTAGLLVQPLGQTSHQVPAGLAGEHFALARLGQAQQAERGDGRVARAGPARYGLPAAVRLTCPLSVNANSPSRYICGRIRRARSSRRLTRAALSESRPARRLSRDVGSSLDSPPSGHVADSGRPLTAKAPGGRIFTCSLQVSTPWLDGRHIAAAMAAAHSYSYDRLIPRRG